MTGQNDRTLKALLLILVIGVWGLLLRPIITPAAAQAPSNSIKWEYKVLDMLTPQSQSDMQAVGKNGWELVQIISGQAFFKRRLP